MNRFFNVKSLAVGSIIAALYVAVVLIFQPISFGPFQLRIAEFLTILPFFTPLAIPGILVGCLVANIFSPYGLPDMIIGTVCSTLAAVCTYYIGKYSKLNRSLSVVLATIPPVLINAVGIGLMLSLLYSIDTWYIMMTQVGGGQILSATIGGSLLALGIIKTKTDRFLRTDGFRFY